MDWRVSKCCRLPAGEHTLLPSLKVIIIITNAITTLLPLSPLSPLSPFSPLSDGRLYVWGDNYEGALGTGGKTDQVKSFTLFLGI
jgi:hypothetical protein